MSKPTPPPHSRSSWARIVLGISILVILLSLFLPASWVELGYSRTIYPWIQAALVPIFGAIPFPVMGSLLVVFLLATPWVIWRRWRKARAAGSTRISIWGHGLLRSAGGLTVVYATFLILWGMGYRRVPIEQRWGLRREAATAEVLQLVDLQLNTVLAVDQPMGRITPAMEARASEAIRRSTADLVEELEGFRPTLPKHYKNPPFGLFSQIGISGIISPFTLEAHVEPALPLPFRIMTGGHELAHLLGYCGEAEANLVSYVAALRSDDPLARFSAALVLSMQMISTRTEEERERWVNESLPRSAAYYLHQLDAYSSGEHLDWTPHKISVTNLPPNIFFHLIDAGLINKARVGRGSESDWADAAWEVTTRASRAMNSVYLKSQGVARGVEDYGRGFDLFLQAYARGLLKRPKRTLQSKPATPSQKAP